MIRFALSSISNAIAMVQCLLFVGRWGSIVLKNFRLGPWIFLCASLALGGCEYCRLPALQIWTFAVVNRPRKVSLTR